MTLRDRIVESENSFKELQLSREEHLKAAEDCLTEMTKLQGEWRVLNDLLTDEAEGKKVNKKAAVIEAVPEES